MMTDPIADLLTRIRNAQTAKHETVLVRTSALRNEILRILKDEGYINDFHAVENTYDNAIVELKYFEERPVITCIKRESTPGRRVYVRHNSIPEVLGGMGVAIVSTSSGVMTGKQAAEKRLGGELICTVY